MVIKLLDVKIGNTNFLLPEKNDTLPLLFDKKKRKQK
jgi:hypothetical protein